MKFAKLTASTAALLLSSSALMAQEAQTMQSVFIDVGGTAVLVPMDVALEACGMDATTLQTAAQGRIDESGIDQTQFMTQMDSAMGMMNGGDAAAQDTAAAGAATTTGTAGATAEGTASADASGAAAGAAGMDASGGVSDTTQTADANATTDMGNTTTDMGNSTDTATADASGAAAGDASGGAAGTTETATADASGAASQDATAAGTADVQNVESTAADTTGDAGAMGSASADPFVTLAACQIDATRATELQIDTTRTGSSLGFDAATLGIQTQ